LYFSGNSTEKFAGGQAKSSVELSQAGKI